jgi:predicted porin
MKLGEDKTATTSANDTVSLNVKYANGPLLVGFAHQTEEALAGDTTFNLLGGAYDFGTFKLVGSYTNVSRDSSATYHKDKEYQFGVSAPFGPTTLYFGYANAKSDNSAGVRTQKADGYSVVATYALSKRTDVYAAYKSVDKKDTINGDGELKQLGLGIRHAF